MRMIINTIAAVLFAYSVVPAGVIRESKSSVSFAGLGKYTEKTVTKLSGLKRSERSISDFESDNVLFNMASGLFTEEGNKTELTDLNVMKVFNVDHDKQEYTESPIRKITQEEKDAVRNMDKSEPVAEEEEDTQEKNNMKLIRREFKVNDTGEKENINGFDCKKYTLHYLSEWEDTETGERSKDSLFTVVWTTEFSSDFQKAHDEEMQFGKAYLKAIGIEMDDIDDEILGLSWFSMFGKMGKGSMDAPDVESANMAKEMDKIKGYPVLIDGSYYVIGPPEEEEAESGEEEEESTVDVTDMGSLFGAITKQVVKSETKKPEKKKNEPMLTYRTELLRYEWTNIPENELSVPAGYKKVSGE